MLRVQLEAQQVSRDILRAIQAGMPVYDVADRRLGVVVRVYDNADAKRPLVGRAPMVNYVDHLPQKTADRLRQDGYVVVDSGLLAGDYFILPNQITTVTENAVLLHFRQESLLQL